jgi:hypothetical protein
MAMMAITTNSSISVNARRPGNGTCLMASPLTMEEKGGKLFN